MRVFGIDFTSAPRKRKPIACALCTVNGPRLSLDGFVSFETLEVFDNFLVQPGPWIAGLDFPFGQPRKLVENLDWPGSWAGYVSKVAELGLAGFAETLREYREAREPGDKQHLREADRRADARSPMMLHGVPVGRMFVCGAPRLLNSGASIVPCHINADDGRILVEAYPALAARKGIGSRSYKHDTAALQTRQRTEARRALVAALMSGRLARYYHFEVSLQPALAETMVSDGAGDWLDAFLCAIQAAWAYSERERNYGMPAYADALEGWIADPALLSEKAEAA